MVIAIDVIDSDVACAVNGGDVWNCCALAASTIKHQSGINGDKKKNVFAAARRRVARIGALFYHGDAWRRHVLAAS